MDDVTAIQVQMSSDYPNLSQDEVVTLMNSKYKLDPDLHTEDEVKLSQLQLKIDAQNARQAIDELRDQYAAPEVQQSNDESLHSTIAGTMPCRPKLKLLMESSLTSATESDFTFGLNDQSTGRSWWKRTLALTSSLILTSNRMGAGTTTS